MSITSTATNPIVVDRMVNPNDHDKQEAMLPNLRIPEGGLHPDGSHANNQQKNNALVAESDVQAAVQAIHETFRAHEARLWKKKKSKEGEGDVGSANDYDDDGDDAGFWVREIHGAALQHRAQIMIESLYRKSQVIPDDIYNSFVKEYCTEYDLSSDGDESDDESDKHNSEGKVEDEFDPQELMDQSAKDKVDALRKQVLERARQIQTARATAIQTATRIARDATQRLVEQKGEAAAPPSSSAAEKGVPAPDGEMVKQRLSSLRNSVTQLKEQLLTSEQRLEKQLERLKSTVAVIEKHQVQGARDPTRKVDELMRTDFHVSFDPMQNDENVLDPTQRLAEFLRH